MTEIIRKLAACGQAIKKGEKIEKTTHTYKDGKCSVCGAADPDYRRSPADSVRTGDGSNIILWLSLVEAGLIGMGAVLLRQRRHYKRK